ncbi:hypothetical protein FNF31_04260 [Cafeteria roenbergensis]|nr:hypothetical protein FNF31_04260 [Cafeteria roenbergensis]
MTVAGDSSRLEAAARGAGSRSSRHLWQAGKTFASLGLSGDVLSRLEAKPEDVDRELPSVKRRGLGLETPTRVQRAAVPLGWKGRDLLVRAETGSGKTLAFLLPVVDWLVRKASAASRTGNTTTRSGTRCLILAPTRELASQIEDVAQRLCQPFPWLVVGSVTGGEKRKSEKARLRKGVTILVATPGRLVDHLEKTRAMTFGGLTRLKWLVMDEADRLLDLGFESQVKAVLDAIEEAKRHAEMRRLQEESAAAEPDSSDDEEEDDDDEQEHDEEEEEEEEEGGDADDDEDEDDEESEDGGGQRARKGRGAATAAAAAAAAVAAGPRNWTVSLFSATLSSGVRRLAGIALADPVFIDGDTGVITDTRSGEVTKLDAGPADAAPKSDGDLVRMPRQLSQFAVPAPTKWRLVTLLGAIRHFLMAGPSGPGSGKLVVFFATCDGVDFHYALLQKLWAGLAPPPPVTDAAAAAAVAAGPSPFAAGGAAPDAKAAPATGLANSCVVQRLHGNLKQPERQTALSSFSGARGGLLLATDVVARGIDLPRVDAIVQADPPESVEEYAHRAGRTARSGKAGQAALLLAPHEMPLLDVLATHGIRSTKQSNVPFLRSLRLARLPLEVSGLDLTKLRASAMRSEASAAASDAMASMRRGDDSGSDGDDDDDRKRRQGGQRPGFHGHQAGGAGGAGGGGASGPKVDRRARMRLLAGALESSRSRAPDSSLKDSSGDLDNASRGVELDGVRWQVLCEEMISGPHRDPALHLAAIKAYTAHVRAYACFGKELRSFLHPRALHLGHLAKAYGLVDQPSKLDTQQAENEAYHAKRAAEAGPDGHSDRGGRGGGRGGGSGRGGRGRGGGRGGFGGDRGRGGGGRGSFGASSSSEFSGGFASGSTGSSRGGRGRGGSRGGGRGGRGGGRGGGLRDGFGESGTRSNRLRRDDGKSDSRGRGGRGGRGTGRGRGHQKRIQSAEFAM